MSRRSYAKTQTVVARIRPVLQAFATMATFAAAAFAGTIV